MVGVTRITALAGVAGSFLLAYGVASCGSSGDGGGTTPSVPEGGAPLTNADGGAPPDGAAQQPGSQGPSSADQACGSQDQAGCETCCARGHQSGANVLTQALADCLCGPPIGKKGVCQSECQKSDCSPSDDASAPASGDPCDTCERSNVLPDGGGGCGPTIAQTCGADQDCVALFQCWDLCAK